MRFPPTIRVGLLWGPLRFRTRSFLTRTGVFAAARRIPHANEVVRRNFSPSQKMLTDFLL